MITKLIKSLAGALDQARIPYMIIGGQAVLLYGSPRLTLDIDITLGIDTDRIEAIEGVCKILQLKFLVPQPRHFAAQTKVLPVQDTATDIRVDFIFSFTPYEKIALGRVNKVNLEDQIIKFASAEDIIIHKILAARPIDLQDVEHILIKHTKTLDFNYIQRWLSEFAQMDQYTKVLIQFKRLVKNTRGRI